MRPLIIIFVDNKKRDFLAMTYLAENFEMNGISTLLVPWSMPESFIKRFFDSIKPQAVLMPHARKTAEYTFDFLYERQIPVFIHDTEGWMYRRRVVSYLNNEFRSNPSRPYSI